jgi:hypothetical protein
MRRGLVPTHSGRVGVRSVPGGILQHKCRCRHTVGLCEVRFGYVSAQWRQCVLQRMPLWVFLQPHRRVRKPSQYRELRGMWSRNDERGRSSRVPEVLVGEVSRCFGAGAVHSISKKAPWGRAMHKLKISEQYAAAVNVACTHARTPSIFFPNQASCRFCTPGQMSAAQSDESDQKLPTLCITCTAGRFSPRGATACTECMAGHYQVEAPRSTVCLSV